MNKRFCQFEVEFMAEGAEDWWQGKYLTIKFLDHTKNKKLKNIEVGLLSIIGTLDCSIKGEILGPKNLAVHNKNYDLCRAVQNND